MIHHATTDRLMRMKSTARTAPVAFITRLNTSIVWPGPAAVFPTVTMSACGCIGGFGNMESAPGQRKPPSARVGIRALVPLEWATVRALLLCVIALGAG